MRNLVKPGDAVILGHGRVGLLVSITPSGKRGAVQFVNNGPLHYYALTSLYRATLGEIETSPLAGVGCNQATEDTR